MPARRTPTPFGRAVKMRLCELDLQQRDLARMLGTSGAYVTYLIYGDRRDDAWVERICQALDMELPRAAQRGTDLRKPAMKEQAKG